MIPVFAAVGSVVFADASFVRMEASSLNVEERLAAANALGMCPCSAAVHAESDRRNAQSASEMTALRSSENEKWFCSALLAVHSVFISLCCVSSGAG